MYTGRGFREWEIGDIDVIFHEGTYHLFHLVLPNHDYIAHAVSKDGISWERVKNALFIGEPGEWDDDMLWTMHVSQTESGFEMFYTGLSLKEQGHVQRVGRATSKDLFIWEKDQDLPFPLEASTLDYESKGATERGWVSFRDPFLFKENDYELLLICARTRKGATSRRGCVGAFERSGERNFKLIPPIFSPLMYDDVECPCLFKIGKYYYLLGSMREDIKVHYWFAETPVGEFQAYHNNVLMPQGNYAARVREIDGHHLIYCFYMKDLDVINGDRYLPPPKELDVDDHGHLILKSYHAWQDKVTSCLEQADFPNFNSILRNPSAQGFSQKNGDYFSSRSGYEIFVVQKSTESFIWEGKIQMIGRGKCGLVFDSDEMGNGYFISLDLINGLAQIRAWGFNEKDIYNNFVFNDLQSNVFKINKECSHHFKLIHYGDYIELSIDGKVVLSLVDKTYNHRYVGVYCESSEVVLSESKLCGLMEPSPLELG